jgi:hypothetical protein
MKAIGIIILLLYQVVSFAQDTICVKGYVVNYKGILPDVSITIKNCKSETTTNSKGKFKIYCSFNDTLEFDYNSSYIPVKYVVKNDNFLVIELTSEIEGNQMGKISPIYPQFYKHSLSLSSTIFNYSSINFAYSYIIDPLFQYNSHNLIPRIGFGMNLSYYNQKYILFPNFTLFIRNNYSIHNFDFSIFIPNISLGYYFDASNPEKNNAFGYNIETYLFYTTIKNTDLKLRLGYNNYSVLKNAFTLGITVYIINTNKQKFKIIEN